MQQANKFHIQIQEIGKSQSCSQEIHNGWYSHTIFLHDKRRS